VSHFPETVVTRDPQTHLCRYDFSAYRPLLPHRWIDGLERYFNEGIEPGGCLRAMLENDLQGVIRRMGPFESTGTLQGLLDLLAEGAPSLAWGSESAVNAWLLNFDGRKGSAG